MAGAYEVLSSYQGVRRLSYKKDAPVTRKKVIVGGRPEPPWATEIGYTIR